MRDGGTFTTPVMVTGYLTAPPDAVASAAGVSLLDRQCLLYVGQEAG